MNSRTMENCHQKDNTKHCERDISTPCEFGLMKQFVNTFDKSEGFKYIYMEN